MFTIPIGQSNDTVSKIMFWSTYIMLVPFLVADLSVIGIESSNCLLVGSFGQKNNIFSYFILGEWIVQDAYIKLAIIASCFFFSRLRRETGLHKIMFAIYGNVLSLFWWFNLGWAIGGGILYWGNVVGSGCQLDGTISSYMPAILITNYIFIPIGLVVSSLRPR